MKFSSAFCLLVVSKTLVMVRGTCWSDMDTDTGECGGFALLYDSPQVSDCVDIAYFEGRFVTAPFWQPDDSVNQCEPVPDANPFGDCCPDDTCDNACLPYGYNNDQCPDTDPYFVDYHDSTSRCRDTRIVENVGNVGADGDPHVKTWDGKWFDYMGQCDLVLVHAPNFDGSGKDLNLHIRTTVRFDYSYIESAALQIGGDILEISSFGAFAVNGVETPQLDEDNGLLAGYDIDYTQLNKKKHKVVVALGPKENITISTFKDLVAVSISAGPNSAKYFSKSTGIMGSYTGSLLARDGVTVMEDKNEFGQEWQVNGEEPMLFRASRDPQYPQACVLPDPAKSEGRRRLGATVAKKTAEDACAHFSGDAFDRCVFDVMAVGDVEIADAGAF